MDITTIALITLAVGLFIWSFKKDKDKTKESLSIAKGRFKSIAVEIISILALIGLFLTVVPPESIKYVLGGSSKFLSTIYAALFGTVTIIPAFVAFPLSASLLDRGAHLVSLAAFITTLTMVGFVTAPIEIEHFGKRFTLVRNVLSFISAILISLGMGLIL